MIALQLLEVKDCMQKLLLSDTFDNFSFIDGSITTFTTFTFDGYIHKDFYNTDEQEILLSTQKEYVSWAEMRDYCYHVIKGKNTPLSFKFILRLSKENIAKILQIHLPNVSIDQVQGLYLNFQYDSGKLDCITGTSMKTFTMDKTLDHIWDEMATKYLKQKEIVFEQL